MSDLNRAIDLIKRGQKDQARQILISLLKENRRNEQAWLYLAACANSKSEFSHSIQEVLKINPNHPQALEQAEKYNIPLPEEAIAAQKAAKKQRPRKAARAERSGGGRLRRIILLLLLIVVIGGAAVFLTREDDRVETEAIVGTQDATAEATPEVTLEATEESIAPEAVTEEATVEVTEIVTEDAVELAIIETEESIEATASADTPTPRPTSTPRPTQTPVTVEAVETESIVEATPTPTPTTRVTPTPAATDTPAPSPTAAVPAGDVTASLVYDEDSIYIINLTDENLDISTLRFVQENPDTPDDPRDFLATEWQNDNYSGPGSVYQLQPDSCFSIGVDVPGASTKPVDCIRLTQWQTRRDISQFWVKFEGGPDEFLVYQGETLIATCPLDAFSCDLVMLPPEE